MSQWKGPTAAISWDNLNHIRVYGLDGNNVIHEWQWDNAGKWTGPSRLGPQVREGTVVAATNKGERIRLYFEGTDGRAYEKVYENGWKNPQRLP